MQSRKAEFEDWTKAIPKLVEAITKSDSLVMLDINIECVVAHLMESAHRGGAFVIDEKYLVVYDFYPLWYSPTSLAVHEQLVLAIEPEAKGSMFSVLKFLNDEKARLNAVHLIVGDLLVHDREKYGRVLTKCGMQKFNSLYAC